MKKLLVVLLVLALLMPAAWASANVSEEANAAFEYNWDVATGGDPKLGADTGFHLIPLNEVTMTLWLPDLLEPTELTQEYIEQNYVALFCNANRSSYVAVRYASSSMSLEDMAARLTSLGAENVTSITVNGLPAVSYVESDKDAAKYLVLYSLQ